MQPITKELTGIVAAAFAAGGYDAALGAVTASDRPELCQFQCNGALSGAKLYKKNPLVIAEEVAARLADHPLFARAEAVRPGFINLTLTDGALLERLGTLDADPHQGVPQAERAETVLLDYGGPNVAKPLHIGHLRPAIIGEALRRLALATGRQALGDVHLGDWGLPMGQVITELEARNPGWRVFAADFDPAADEVPRLEGEELNEIYPFASARCKEDADYKRRAQAATVALQAGRPGYIALWRELVRASLTDIKANYATLNVHFDLWRGESDADPYIAPLLEILTQRGLLEESEGAQVVQVVRDDDKAPMPPVMVKKTDGASAYATTDLATILQREREYHPGEMWYVTDKRQSLHFEQIFRCAKKAGLVPDETVLAHCPNGTINGADGKPFKTRDGGVMRLSALIDAVVDAAHEKIRASGIVEESEQREVARRVGIAALKFGDMINHRTKEYSFDMEKALAFEGKTGTYLLYTMTRIQSILAKAGAEPAGVTAAFHSDVERALGLAMLLTGEVFARAYTEKAPNYLCENAFLLASLFSKFYHETHILNEPDAAKQRDWLALCRQVRDMLRLHLDVLGIEAVEKM